MANSTNINKVSGSKYDIYDYADRNYSEGGNAFTYVSEGKLVDGTKVPAKILLVSKTTPATESRL